MSENEHELKEEVSVLVLSSGESDTTDVGSAATATSATTTTIIDPTQLDFFGV
jgi:hypothetical protein